MKTIVSLLLFIGLSVGMHAQSFWEWSDPFPLTDSISNNLNAYLTITEDDLDNVIMFWEKEIDSISTAIYMDNISDDDSAVQILYTPGIRYTNPKPITLNIYDSETSIFLIYLSNENGNNDIYSKAILRDFSFLEPIQLTNSVENEDEFTIAKPNIFWDNYQYIINMVAYTRNGRLFVRNLMSENGDIFFASETLIDYETCTGLVGLGVWGDLGLYYLKSDTGEYHVFKCISDHEGEWFPPEKIFDSTDCRNVNVALHYEIPVWSAYRDSTWKIMSRDYMENYTYDSIYDEHPLDPAALGFVIGVKSWAPEIWVATPFSENDTNEIFMTSYAGNIDFLDFTSSGTINRNPQFYEGERYYNYWCWYDYLVWESYRNGHWQIWASKVLQCAGSVDENEGSKPAISTHPNPFTQETTITFELISRSDVRIEAYDLQGRLVDAITQQSYDQGEHQVRWIAKSLPEGVYVIRMTIDGEVYTSKLVKAH